MISAAVICQTVHGSVQNTGCEQCAFDGVGWLSGVYHLFDCTEKVAEMTIRSTVFVQISQNDRFLSTLQPERTCGTRRRRG